MATSYGQITLSKVNDGESVTVSKTEYQSGTSNTTAPTGTWSTSPVSVAEGSFLWTKVTYSDGKVAYSVAKQGKSGASVEVTKTEYAYQLSTSGTAVPTGTWKTTPQAPTTTQFAWTRTTTTFSDGKTAVTYTVGGKTGTSVTVSSQSVTYQAGTSGTTKPTGTWQSSVPSVSEGQYLWTKTVVNYSDGKSTEAYSVSRNAVNGNSPTVSSTVVEYQQSTNGATPPTGTWQSSAPSAKAGQYMWTRTTVTYSDNATAISYTVSRNGSDGTSPTAYNLIVSHAAVAKSQNGEYNPSSITLSAKSQTGSDAWKDYPGYFMIDTTEDNTTWTNRYTSGANESTKTYEISPDGWAVTDSEPYLLRKSAGNGDIKSIAIENAIVGGSVVWNQLADNSTPPTSRNGLTFTGGDGFFTISGTATASATATGWFKLAPTFHSFAGHVIIESTKLVSGTVEGSINFRAVESSTFAPLGTERLVKPSTDRTSTITISNGAVCTDAKIRIQVFDLTQMFGSTVADYIYSLEQATAGAGVAFFRSLFSKPYYAYNAGTLMSVKTSAHKMVGFNQWDEEWEVGGLNASGAVTGQTDRIRSKNLIPVIAGQTYYFKGSYYLWAYDSNGVFINRLSYNGIGSTAGVVDRTVLIPSGVANIKFVVYTSYGTTYNNDICINLSDPSRNGMYEPYVSNTYPLDSSLTLRGLPKLDGDSIYYDGDIYPPSGKGTRRYFLADMGTMNWRKSSRGNYYYASFGTTFPNYAIGADIGMICSKYVFDGAKGGAPYYGDDKTIGSFLRQSTTGPNEIYVHDESYSTVEAFQSAMSGVYLIYPLETPESFTAEPYTALQICDPNGTEEYIDTRDVPIPVGHVTKYSPDITGIRCSLYLEKSTTTLLDQQTVPIVSDGINGDSGKDAYTVLLTNESHTFAGGKTAAIGGQTATIGVVGYRGTVQRATTVGTITGAPTGMTATISNNSTTSTTVTVSVTSSMTTKNGTLTIPVTVDDTVFNLIFSYAIAFTGASGVGTSGLGWKVNYWTFSKAENGECYFHGYNDNNDPADVNGWVMWNGNKLTIEKGYWVNPNTVAPYNTSILHVYRTSGSTPALRHCDVWWDSTTGKWMGYNYSGNNTTPAGKAEWIWDEATDCILATYVEPSSEGKIVSAQLFNPPKKYSELPDPKIGFDLEDLTETVEELQPELIVGTHGTTATATWTGTSTKLKTISAGTRIQYKLSSAGASNVTLNLTLADGTKTGAKNVFYSNTTRLGIQYGINAIIDLVYDGSAWRILNPYTNNDTVGVRGGVITAGTNGAKAYGLVMKDSSTTWASFTTTGGNGASKAKYTGGFEISNLMCFSNSSNLVTGSKAGTAYEALGIDFRYSSNCAQTLTSGQELYIVGQIHNDGLFYLDDTWWTQTEPTSNDGKTYIYVGITYSTYQVYLSTSNPAMQFYNGEFLTIEKIETIKAQEAAEAASKVATNYLDFNEQTGLDVGYSGTQAKTRISGDGVEIFDAQGVSMQEISSRTEEVDGQSVQVPFVRTGYTDQGHVETSSGGIDIKYGPEDTEYHTDLIAHLGYGDTVADPIWGEAQPGEIVQAPFYSFGPRALLWEDNDNVDHDADVGQYSFVTGKGCVGGGPWSYVGGYGNVTLNEQSFSTVVGYWNDPDEPGAFVVGGGSAPAIGQRRNTMVVGGEGHAVMIHGDTYIDGGLTAKPQKVTATKSSVTGINLSTLNVYKCGGICVVNIALTSSTTLSNWTTIATGLPVPVVGWYSTMMNWENTYHRPYRVTVTTSGNLNIQYGAGSSSDSTAYAISFSYPMAT